MILALFYSHSRNGPVEVRHETEDRLEVLDGAQQELVDDAEGLFEQGGHGHGRQFGDYFTLMFVTTAILRNF